MAGKIFDEISRKLPTVLVANLKNWDDQINSNVSTTLVSKFATDSVAILKKILIIFFLFRHKRSEDFKNKLKLNSIFTTDLIGNLKIN